MVVVIGGGFCGYIVTAILSKMPRFKVLLISDKEYFEYTPSVLKVLVNPALQDKIKVENKTWIGEHGRIFIGTVESVNLKQVTVAGKKISFDYLVIASGSRYSSNLKTKQISTTYREKVVRADHERLVKAQRVLVVGGGLVGVECATEIKAAYPDKEVTIVESGAALVKRVHVNVQRKALRSVLAMNIKVDFNTRIMDVDPAETKWVAENGKVYDADIAFIATGPAPNSHFMKPELPQTLDEKMWIKVRV